MSSDDEQYRQLFIDEAKEHIDTITKSMLILEKEPDNTEIINMLFRSAHTLKGSSGMMGFKDFQELTHAMEDVFDDMRKGNRPSSDLISVLLECVDALTMRLSNIQNRVEGEIEVAALKGRLLALRKEIQRSEPAKQKETAKINDKPLVFDFDAKEQEQMKQAAIAGDHGYIVDLHFANDCGFKSIRAGMVLDKIAEVANVVKSVPASNDLDEQKLSQGFKFAVTTKLDEKEIQECAQQVLEVEKVQVSPFDVSDPKEEPALLPPDKNYTLTIDNKKITKIAVDTQSTQSVRVKFEQLDKLMNWVGELVINKIALLQITGDIRNDQLKHITENIDRLTSDLQELVMEVRMVPVSQVFDRFPRLVRDLSLKKEKKIELVLKGKEIEIDRTVLDEIGEPLIHLLRNSIDHGIEMPEDREKQGKTATGTITLMAQRNGNHVMIDILDDGAGIDPEKVKASAIKKGFASQSELDKMSNEQLINLIFLPGFSTAKVITETSGRGVGMDVVKTKISALGGTVHIESQVGEGTKTTIKLPITLAIIQAILVNDANQTFAIPAGQVLEIVRVKNSDVKSLGKTSAILVRDHVVPIVHLHQLLNLPDSNENEFEIMIINQGSESNKIGLVVDSVSRQQDILVKPLNETLAKIKGVIGATILGDGQIVIVLDIGQFVTKNKEINRI